MNSKFSAQILYSSFVLLLIIVDSLQSPISEDSREKRASHKLMRFGRAPHQMMHFGKRTIDSNEDDLTNAITNDSFNDVNQADQQAQNNLIKYLVEQMSRKNNDPDTGYMSMMERRSETRPYVAFSAYPRKYYPKKAENRENVFMHFG